MPVTEKDFRELSADVVALKTAAKITQWVVGLGGTAAISAALLWGCSIDRKMTTLTTHGDLKLLSSISDPASTPESVRANLSFVKAQIQSEAAAGKKASPEKLAKVAATLSTVVQKQPDIPEAWQAASALISAAPVVYDPSAIPTDLLERAGPPVPNLGDCTERPFNFERNEATADLEKQRPNVVEALVLHDCTINLGDPDAFDASSLMMKLKERYAGKNLMIMLALVRVKVIYHGGALIPAKVLGAYGCSYDFSVQMAPPPPGRRLFASVLDQNFEQGVAKDLVQG